MNWQILAGLAVGVTTLPSSAAAQVLPVVLLESSLGDIVIEFFICIGDQPELDFGGTRNPDGQGFAAFGRMVSGMDVVRRVQTRPAEGQRLRPPVQILRVVRR